MKAIRSRSASFSAAQEAAGTLARSGCLFNADLHDDADLAVADPVGMIVLMIVPGGERALGLARLHRQFILAGRR